ncbi:formylglycine-generating enzyme family protein [Nitrosomonas sp. wSCUT-2]
MDNNRFPPAFPEPWASEWGQDRFGLYMDLNYQGVCQRFRWILPCNFLMGSPENEVERSADEILHPVTLTRGFWLADTTCTQALWQAVMNENPSEFIGDLGLPVESVNWLDVQQFIERLNTLFPDLQVHFPTEAQWEYACRAGTQTPFSFGDDITPKQVNYDGNYPYVGGGNGLFRGKTVPVKSLPPNAWGLYEMHGNVWEWCADWYGDYPREAVIDPIGPGQGDRRVVRGGSWYFHASYTRSACRYGLEPEFRAYSLGFRLVSG